MNKLTNDLFNEFSRMYAERAYSTTVYSGYGTTIDQMIEEFLEMGGEWGQVMEIRDRAYEAAMDAVFCG